MRVFSLVVCCVVWVSCVASAVGLPSKAECDSLFDVARNGSPRVLRKALSDLGSEAGHCADKDRRTPIHVAAQYRRRDNVQLLLNYYPSNDQDKVKGEPLHYAVSRREQDDDPKLVQMLVEAGADPMAQMANRDTALSVAARNGHIKSIRYLFTVVTPEFAALATNGGHTAAQNARMVGDKDVADEIDAFVAGKHKLSDAYANRAAPEDDEPNLVPIVLLGVIVGLLLIAGVVKKGHDDSRKSS